MTKAEAEKLKEEMKIAVLTANVMGIASNRLIDFYEIIDSMATEPHPEPPAAGEKFFAERDGKATIQLCIPTETNPWNKVTLKIVDFGRADNVYVCELPSED